jgi:hypothetical protein
MKRALPRLGASHEKLELPTIMNPALAARYGTSYVHLAAFAIDTDRVYLLDPATDRLAFGWEVFLAECYAVAALSFEDERACSLLEETCLSILEQAPDDQGLGSQLVFAVHDAIERGLYPASLKPVFRSWRSPPRQLRAALDALWADAEPQLAAAAAHCLGAALDPPLTPPTRQTLERMQTGGFPILRSAAR